MSVDQTTKSVPNNDYIQLNNGTVNKFTFEVVSGEIALRTGDTKPNENENGFMYKKGQGELKKSIDELFSTPGTNIYAKSLSQGDAQVHVDHD